MKEKYDPETQGKTLSDEEINALNKLNPDFSAYSLDEPELTEDLVKRMKKAKNLKKIGYGKL